MIKINNNRSDCSGKLKYPGKKMKLPCHRLVERNTRMMIIQDELFITPG